MEKLPKNSIFLRSGNESNEVTQTPEELKARLLQHCEWNIAELVKGFCVEMPKCPSFLSGKPAA